MESLRRVRNRAGRCYELAWKVMIDEPGSDQFQLVHGWLTLPQFPQLYGHAWIVLPGDRIYDPVMNRYFTHEEYAAKFNAAVERSYSRQEAFEALRHYHHFGPWDDRFPPRKPRGSPLLREPRQLGRRAATGKGLPQ
jgi:hypothetical protein